MLPENNAWHVVVVHDDSPAETPFLVSRNAKASAIAYPANDEELDNPGKNAVLIPLDANTQPFGANRAVCLTKGGSSLEMRMNFFTRARVCPFVKPKGEPALTVLPAQGGFQ